MKFFLGVDILEAEVPELITPEYVLKMEEIEKKLNKKYAGFAPSDPNKLRELYATKLAEIVRLIKKKEPKDVIGML